MVKVPKTESGGGYLLIQNPKTKPRISRSKAFNVRVAMLTSLNSGPQDK